jgi:hypothetical protein
MEEGEEEEGQGDEEEAEDDFDGETRQPRNTNAYVHSNPLLSDFRHHTISACIYFKLHHRSAHALQLSLFVCVYSRRPLGWKLGSKDVV